MRDRERQKKPNWLSLAVVLLLVAPEIVLPIGICAGIGYLVFKLVKENAYRTPSAKTTYTRKQPAFDDCPKKLFCFHKDKGEHHVARGKEMDPWERPDIDISKYQRKG